METTIYKGHANIYNPATQEITKTQNWKGTFTQEQVQEWMQERDGFLRSVYEYDSISWRLWEDGCYRMTAYRHEKKSKRGATLRPMAICYIFTPMQ